MRAAAGSCAGGLGLLGAAFAAAAAFFALSGVGAAVVFAAARGGAGASAWTTATAAHSAAAAITRNDIVGSPGIALSALVRCCGAIIARVHVETVSVIPRFGGHLAAKDAVGIERVAEHGRNHERGADEHEHLAAPRGGRFPDAQRRRHNVRPDAGHEPEESQAEEAQRKH